MSCCFSFESGSEKLGARRPERGCALSNPIVDNAAPNASTAVRILFMSPP
jgi:hypothetical protein